MCVCMLLLNTVYVYNFSPKLRKVLRNAIEIGEKVFRKPGIVSELAYSVADNLSVAYSELHTNLKQVK